ncbi:anthranilate phosphoribosyltransferase [Gluconobacter roseus NBRC 3990]|uniref:Anthranilate phosphoribosyltransferase n=2 Tax=Gluconobacter roseus TaxID=586239 RepID=A0A4Y3M2S3_9PROT|nr:anthranilate phosphoribosyltransferase [Gluconobacter roseus NBRC 3990]GEB03600.1 anthranilate phosphoribosyltransferase [Gluconobacter roseus NBRC 3990]GLP94055.1 anthranilate phosphoribosyltransferase [Gluconobacter roseus NBRC 3990]
MSVDFTVPLHKVASGQPLDSHETEGAFHAIMAGEVDPVHLSAFLTALKLRGETFAELTGAVQAVRHHMTVLPDVPEGTIDVCGTGGDGLKTLNVSTAVAFVLAGLGVPVAKHGNRALSSATGATDVLEVLGIPPTDDLELQGRRLREDKLVFLAAPQHHPAMRHAAPVRKALGFRTLFNLLGPLCNPAQVRHQLIGVFDGRWCEPVARALGALGSLSVWVVHGSTEEGGSDELTLAGPSQVSAWQNDALFSFGIEPEMAGFQAAPISAIRGGDARTNASALISLLDGAGGAYRDTVLLNAAAALHVAGRGDIVKDGAIDAPAFRRNVGLAADSIDRGLARAALERARMSAPSIASTDAGRS